MNIDRVNISNQGVDRSQTVQGTDGVLNSGKNRPVPSGSDSVALSTQAKDLDRLSGAIEQSRTEHFNKVRQALESGTYQVPAKALARKLIDANTQ